MRNNEKRCWMVCKHKANSRKTMYTRIEKKLWGQNVCSVQALYNCMIYAQSHHKQPILQNNNQEIKAQKEC